MVTMMGSMTVVRLDGDTYRNLLLIEQPYGDDEEERAAMIPWRETIGWASSEVELILKS